MSDKNLISLVRWLKELSPGRLLAVEESLVSGAVPCDCGAEKARTTHAHWCSSRLNDELKEAMATLKAAIIGKVSQEFADGRLYR